MEVIQSVPSEDIYSQPGEEKLENKIADRSAKLGVVGLGYVGFPLAVEMARAGFHVTGIDMDARKVDSINKGISYVPDVPSEIFSPLVAQTRIKATQSKDVISDLDAISICVPTPLRKTRDPDLSYVLAAMEAVRTHLRRGQLIILESTTYPGTTRELVLPMLQETGLRVGEDFFLCFSPERVDPGNKTYNTRNIPKVIGGITSQCTELGRLLYSQMVDRVVPVSSPDCAEVVKLLENTFRSVNIALANEMAMMCQKLGVNIWEVIEAAETKPFGFVPFYPGPGLGGHCIPVDPYYLTWKARVNGFEPRLIEVAGQINSQMPAFTVGRIVDALNERKRSLNGSRILALGVTYKRDTSDIRESPSIEVLRDLNEKGAEVFYSDPYVPSIELNGQIIESTTLTPEILKHFDCLVILTDHSTFDYETIATHAALILDCRNALRDFPGANVLSL
jgi:UDP-N-acetyl-D-glucosamine dehydrogenase